MTEKEIERVTQIMLHTHGLKDHIVWFHDQPVRGVGTYVKAWAHDAGKISRYTKNIIWKSQLILVPHEVALDSIRHEVAHAIWFNRWRERLKGWWMDLTDRIQQHDAHDTAWFKIYKGLGGVAESIDAARSVQGTFPRLAFSLSIALHYIPAAGSIADLRYLRKARG